MGNDTVNDIVNGTVNDTVNDTVNENESGIDNVNSKNDNVKIVREKIEGLLTEAITLKKKIGFRKILEVIADNENITLDQISIVTGISKPTVSRYLAIMKRKGILRREGAPKNGTWVILWKEKKRKHDHYRCFFQITPALFNPNQNNGADASASGSALIANVKQNFTRKVMRVLHRSVSSFLHCLVRRILHPCQVAVRQLSGKHHQAGESG